MSIATEIQRLQAAKADIKATIESKGWTVPSDATIDQYAEILETKLIDARVVAKYNVTSTSNPTQLCYNRSVSQFSAIEIDGVTQPSVVSAYTFSTTGEHTVKYILADPTSIGTAAFQNCTGLTSIDIPNSVTSIGTAAFAGCSSLTSIDIPSGVTSIGDGAFAGCAGLTSIDIPNGVTSIDDGAFTSCVSLTSIDIPSGVTSIGKNTFSNCISLTSIVIPSGVTSIGDSAFQYCGSLTSIDIPSGVTSIGSDAFSECTGLTSIVIPSGVTTISGGVFRSCSSLTSIVIPSGVTSIGSSAFSGCKSLTSIVIPSGVTTISNSLFYNCSGLTSIDIPSGVTSIGSGAFQGCKSLTSIDIPSGVTTISKNLFYNCSGLTSIDIPSGVTSIGTQVFRGCSNLTSIKSNATTAPTIAANTFQNVKTGGTLTVPSGSSGYDVWMGTGNYYLGKYNWTKVYDAKVTAMFFVFDTSSPTQLCDSSAVSQFSAIEIDGVTQPSVVSEYTFSTEDEHTVKYTLTDPTSIGQEAFIGCSDLISIDIPNSVTSIGQEAFAYCHGLTSITSNATTAPTITSSTFYDVNTDGTLTVPAGSTGYDVWMGTGNYYLGKYNWTKVEQ